MFDPEIFAIHGKILGTITTIGELKKWYLKGDKHKPSKTVLIIDLIKRGLTDEEILKSDEVFAFWNMQKIKNFRSEYFKAKPLEPVKVPPLKIDLYSDVHPSALVILRFWSRTVADGVVKKGTGWLHIFSSSNALKSWFVAVTFSQLLKSAYIVFTKQWPDGFVENSYQVLICDGLSEETVKQGFHSQLMEHGTVGKEDSWVFPQKYLVHPMKTNGEIWVTTGNRKLKHIVGDSVFQDIVKNRVTEAEVRDVTDLVRLANIIRLSVGVSAVNAPTITVPDTFYFSQSQASDQPPDGHADAASNHDDGADGLLKCWCGLNADIGCEECGDHANHGLCFNHANADCPLKK